MAGFGQGWPKGTKTGCANPSLLGVAHSLTQRGAGASSRANLNALIVSFRKKRLGHLVITELLLQLNQKQGLVTAQ
jgi:hypothetical protein